MPQPVEERETLTVTEGDPLGLPLELRDRDDEAVPLWVTLLQGVAVAEPLPQWEGVVVADCEMELVAEALSQGDDETLPLELTGADFEIILVPLRCSVIEAVTVAQKVPTEDPEAETDAHLEALGDPLREAVLEVDAGALGEAALVEEADAKLEALEVALPLGLGKPLLDASPE